MAVLVKAAANHPALKVTDKWKWRKDSAMQYQNWYAFHPCAVVEARNCYGDVTIDVAHKLFWGYEQEIGLVSESVIVRARQVFRNGKPVYRVKAVAINPRWLPVVVEKAA